jgi:hypothetical protein
MDQRGGVGYCVPMRRLGVVLLLMCSAIIGCFAAAQTLGSGMECGLVSPARGVFLLLWWYCGLGVASDALVPGARRGPKKAVGMVLASGIGSIWIAVGAAQAAMELQPSFDGGLLSIGAGDGGPYEWRMFAPVIGSALLPTLLGVGMFILWAKGRQPADRKLETRYAGAMCFAIFLTVVAPKLASVAPEPGMSEETVLVFRWFDWSPLVVVDTTCCIGSSTYSTLRCRGDVDDAVGPGSECGGAVAFGRNTREFQATCE